jgi:tRNA(Ile)-lysidine synthase TilS/MesJ
LKCRVCRGPAIIDIRRHNANFCAEHFVRYCEQQLTRAIDEFAMLAPGERVLVAVSGGKDSLAVWDLLDRAGWTAEGLYVGLGIGDYSDHSGHYVRRFAADRGLRLHEIDLRNDHGYDVPTAAAVTGRVPCSACGLSKRHLFDSAARDGGYDAVATGHNLDDEAAVLLGNTLRWETGYLARQRPMLPAGNGFPRKIKPLIRLTERETAAYCVIRNIDYQIDECPMAHGNKHLGYKEQLNELERQSPGAKTSFYFGFLARAVDRFSNQTPATSTGDRSDDVTGDLTGDAPDRDVGTCIECGSPADGERCAFCRLAERAAGAEPVPVEFHTSKRKRRAGRRR